MPRSTAPITPADRARLTAMRDAVTLPSWKPVIAYAAVALVAILLILVAFAIMLNSFKFAGAAPVLASIIMLVVSCIALAVVVLRLPDALSQRRIAQRSLAELDAALQLETVDVLDLRVTQAWLVPWADADTDPPVLFVDDEAMCVALLSPPESIALRVERGEEVHTLVFSRLTLRVTQAAPRRLLSAVGTGPQFIAASTNADWPDDYEKFTLPSGMDDVGVFTVDDLTPAWRELVEKSALA